MGEGGGFLLQFRVRRRVGGGGGGRVGGGGIRVGGGRGVLVEGQESLGDVLVEELEEALRLARARARVCVV